MKVRKIIKRRLSVWGFPKTAYVAAKHRAGSRWCPRRYRWVLMRPMTYADMVQHWPVVKRPYAAVNYNGV